MPLGSLRAVKVGAHVAVSWTSRSGKVRWYAAEVTEVLQSCVSLRARTPELLPDTPSNAIFISSHAPFEA